MIFIIFYFNMFVVFILVYKQQILEIKTVKAPDYIKCTGQTNTWDSDPESEIQIWINDNE